MKKTVKIFIFLLITISIAACSVNYETPDNSSEMIGDKALTISAAVSLRDAMYDIAELYRDMNPDLTINFNYGSSGALQQQISQGAPVDLFFSAAIDKFEVLVEEGRIIEEDSADLLRNSIALIVPSEEHSSLTSYGDLIKEEVDQVAIGMPETVPAGKYSKEFLEELGLWIDVEPKVVYAKDVRQVLSYVETHNVAAGIVYKTDAILSDNVRVVQETEHKDIIYPLGIIKDSMNYDAAKDFLEFLQSDSALEVFEEYGFIVE